ncbi:hypothetical protein GF420_14490 [candidate division GN15 bacterium]|nr:hypothetical protein [candidate division GN15 bacterium]
MSPTRRIGVLLAVMLFACTIAGEVAGVGPVSIEASLAGGNTRNLLKDWSSRETAYSTAGISLGLHPLAMAEIELIGEYTTYGQLSSLSNFRYGAGFTLIPTGDSARTSLLLSGFYHDRDYRDQVTDVTSTEFSSSEYEARAGLAHTFTNSFQARTGLVYRATAYGSDDVRDREALDWYTGVNVTLPGRNVLDVEAGLTHGNLDYVAQSTGGIRPDRAYELLEQADLNTFYFSPRLSRPLGSRTGISLTVSHRQFVEQPDSAVVYGHSTGFLSPWVASYEGQAVAVNVKTFLIPRLITTLGAGYWSKDFLTTVETTDGFLGPQVSTLFAEERSDEQRRVFLNLQWPITGRGGWFIEPSLYLGYVSNSSTIDVYDYTDLSVSTGISVRL